MYPKSLQSQLSDLALFPDRTDRIEALIAIADEYRNFTPDEVPRTEDRRVSGCESEVFLSSEKHPDGTLKFKFAVDNPQGISAMALARILDEGLSGAPLNEVLQVPDDIVYEIFGKELSMGKSMGLIGMLRMLKEQTREAL